MQNKNYICPVCGYDGLEFEPNNSYEICSCCGYEFGTLDYEGKDVGAEFDYKETMNFFSYVRNIWLGNGAEWYSNINQKPQNWDLQNQLKNIISCKEDLIKALYTVDNSNFNRISVEQKKVCCEFTVDIFKKFPNFQYSKELNFPYIIAGNFVDYMQTLIDTDEKELAECLNYIESLFLSEHPYIKELATIGFIEGIQNSWSDENKKLIYRKLGKKSKKAWKDLNKFWEGK